ncbi:MAG: PQQ-like beta-propeller repeat protein [Candidatus Eremiobacteraeota bacterium]|nr:PQQ-like beta-propeller repeat protein [Candidatus Eremiobacteraeota bacterium]
MKRYAVLFLIPALVLFLSGNQAAQGAGEGKDGLLSGADLQKLSKTGIPLVIPHYLPEGFTLSKVDTTIDSRFGNSYSIEYRYGSAVKFYVEAFCGGIGDTPSGKKEYPFTNPVLGKGTIQWTPEKGKEPPFLLSTWLKGKAEFPVYHVRAFSVSPGEAVKVAESLRYYGAPPKASDSREAPVKWKYNCGLVGALAATEGIVCFTMKNEETSENYVSGLDSSKQEVIWEFKFRKATQSALTAFGGVAYCAGGGEQGECHALDAKTGKVKWSFFFDENLNACKPTCYGKYVYLGTGNMGNSNYLGILYALDRATGKEAWRFKAGGHISRPSFLGDAIFAGCGGSHVYAFRHDTGAVLWKAALDGVVLCSPSVLEGKVYAGTGSTFYCLDAKDGSEVWKVPLESDVNSISPLARRGLVFISLNDRQKALAALDAATGRTAWKVPGVALQREPLVSGDLVLAPLWDKGLRAYEVKSGREAWRIQAKSGGPMDIDGGTLYFCDGMYLYAVQP